MYCQDDFQHSIFIRHEQGYAVRYKKHIDQPSAQVEGSRELEDFPHTNHPKHNLKEEQRIELSVMNPVSQSNISQLESTNQ